MINENQIPQKSAGIVIIRHDERRGPCVLLLKIFKKYDLPKGRIEDSDGGDLKSDAVSLDQILNAATRECYEECGFEILIDPGTLLDANVPVARLVPGQDEPIKCIAYDTKTHVPRKIVYLYVAETMCKKATIKKNKKSGIYEHHGYRWESAENIGSSGLHRYLQTGVVQAIELYQSSKSVEDKVRHIVSLADQ